MKFFILIVGLFILISPGTQADTKVVVIPLGGAASTAKPLKNIITVSELEGDFDNPSTALASITDATQSNPYLVVIGPGQYTLADGQNITMKPFVDIVGSGQNTTTIKGKVNGGSNNISTACALIIGADNSELSNLTVINDILPGSGYACTIYNDNASPDITQVTAIAKSTYEPYAMVNQNGASPRVTNVIMDASGGNNGYGMRSLHDGNAILHHVVINVDAAYLSQGISTYDSSPILEDVVSTATGCTNGSAYGIIMGGSIASKPVLINVRASAICSSNYFATGVATSGAAAPYMRNVIAEGSGSNTSRGAYFGTTTASMLIENSVFSAPAGPNIRTGVELMNSPNVKIINNRIENGVIDGSAATNCYNNFDSNFLSVSC